LLIKERNHCPHCARKLDTQTKMQLVDEPEIRCPFCAKGLKLSELSAFWVTFPLFFLLGYFSVKFTDLSLALLALFIIIFVYLTKKPTRRIEVYFSKLKVVS